MKTITPLLLIALVGLACWLLTSYIPMDPMFAKFIVICGIIICIVILLKAIGVWDKIVNS